MNSFPFGMPIEPLRQSDRSQKRVFVLGVYASAVHARWVDEHGTTKINAVAVASEPEIFWRGDSAENIIASISVPEGAGRLVPASSKLNGPTGRALDDAFLMPLGIDRRQVWLCDLLPESRCNKSQAAALEKHYDPVRDQLGLPSYDFPPVPSILSDETRVRQIAEEVLEADSQILVTLGDQPLKWFARKFGSKSCLAAYGESQETYGRLHTIEIKGRRIRLLPLVHPRQAGKLGSYSSKWHNLHARWVKALAPGALARLPLKPYFCE